MKLVLVCISLIDDMAGFLSKEGPRGGLLIVMVDHYNGGEDYLFIYHCGYLHTSFWCRGKYIYQSLIIDIKMKYGIRYLH